MNLIAKPIIKDQYWVITDGDKKIGNVESQGTGFSVKIGDKIEHYTTTKQIEKKVQIEFVKTNNKQTNVDPPFAVYPTDRTKIYNNVLDVRRKLHLYTTTPKSKCYHVAGWFCIKQGPEYEVVFCPKYIFIQRYKYKGPFKSETDAKNSINI